ncbi:hypothetical protein CRG98_023296 [Punica granatum]|uniref:Uncharacterized protein n=1 Tax=Punica granatum TaxID=22663 RepID=A0A2I0JJ50_PUNGR|nr:hypothetical protein CRG98_023296 [Punica granatum]
MAPGLSCLALPLLLLLVSGACLGTVTTAGGSAALGSSAAAGIACVAVASNEDHRGKCNKKCMRPGRDTNMTVGYGVMLRVWRLIAFSTESMPFGRCRCLLQNLSLLLAVERPYVTNSRRAELKLGNGLVGRDMGCSIVLGGENVKACLCGEECGSEVKGKIGGRRRGWMVKCD